MGGGYRVPLGTPSDKFFLNGRSNRLEEEHASERSLSILGGSS